MRAKSLQIAFFVCLGLLGLNISITGQFSSHEIWMDSITRSIKHQITWPFGFKSNPIIERSRLEEWLFQQDGSISNNWRFVGGTGRNILGGSMVAECGQAPPIFSIPEDLLEYFVRTSTDAELAVFIQTMRQGDESRQRVVIDAAIEKATKAIAGKLTAPHP